MGAVRSEVNELLKGAETDRFCTIILVLFGLKLTQLRETRQRFF